MRFTVLLIAATQAIYLNESDPNWTMDDCLSMAENEEQANLCMTGAETYGPGGPGDEGPDKEGYNDFPGATLYIDEVDGEPANITLHVDDMQMESAGSGSGSGESGDESQGGSGTGSGSGESGDESQGGNGGGKGKNDCMNVKEYCWDEENEEGEKKKKCSAHCEDTCWNFGGVTREYNTPEGDMGSYCENDKDHCVHMGENYWHSNITEDTPPGEDWGWCDFGCRPTGGYLDEATGMCSWANDEGELALCRSGIYTDYSGKETCDSWCSVQNGRFEKDDQGYNMCVHDNIPREPYTKED